MTAHWNGGTGGKGSAPRPFSVSHEEWSSRWDAIFQRDLPKEEKDSEESTSEGDLGSKKPE